MERQQQLARQLAALHGSLPVARGPRLHADSDEPERDVVRGEATSGEAVDVAAIRFRDELPYGEVHDRLSGCENEIDDQAEPVLQAQLSRCRATREVHAGERPPATCRGRPWIA